MNTNSAGVDPTAAVDREGLQRTAPVQLAHLGGEVDLDRGVRLDAVDEVLAERLFISPKTADHHVSAILAKLDVRSRRQAADAARRLGLAL
jgi:Bacterial regulatory proteins, luxR family